jgi:hypothetical protein
MSSTLMSAMIEKFAAENPTEFASILTARVEVLRSQGEDDKADDVTAVREYFTNPDFAAAVRNIVR